MTDELTTLRTALAECQARELKYRMALEQIVDVWSTDESPLDCGNNMDDIAQAALQLTTDNSELRAVCLKVADYRILYPLDSDEAIVDEVIGKGMK